MKKPVYMDHHATTPVDPRILEAITPYYLDGCSASEAQQAIALSRGRVARLIGAQKDEIHYTSGATEADNLAVKGIAYANRDRGNHIITSQVEHKAVLDCCERLEQEGFEVTYLPVDCHGMVDPESVSEAITERTILVSLIYANNEIGTINPLEDIGKITRDRGVLFHSDAVQAVGKIPVHVDTIGVDLLSLSAHKMYGAKGIGALYVRRRTPGIRMASILGEDRPRNLPGIVGLGLACEISGEVMPEEGERLKALRIRLHDGLVNAVEDIILNGHPVHRLPGNLNMCFSYIEGGSLLLSLRDIAVSSGSACTSRTTIDPSYVLLALGRDRALAQGALRFGLGRWSTEEEVDYVVETVAVEARKLRSMSAHFTMRHEV